MKEYNIGRELYIARKLNNMTHKDLADLVGVTSQQIISWENDENISYEYIQKLSVALNITVTKLTNEYVGKFRRKAFDFVARIVAIILGLATFVLALYGNFDPRLLFIFIGISVALLAISTLPMQKKKDSITIVDIKKKDDDAKNNNKQ